MARVHTPGDTGDRVFAGTDSGSNHLLRPALYDALADLSTPDGPPRPSRAPPCPGGALPNRPARVRPGRA